jgi:hypothetical protein
MKSPLPGLPTMAFLMLCTLIVVWLGLWGPLLDLEKLRDWQPLMASIIAPTIALGAATLAYHSAMAKVYHDREEAERRRNSERLGLFLRLHTSLSRVLIDIHRCILAVEMTLPQSSEKLEQIGVKARRKPNLLFASLAHHITRDSTIPFATIKAEHMEVYNPPELPEAWSKIDLFPAPLVVDIDVLRNLLPTMEALSPRESYLSLRLRRTGRSRCHRQGSAASISSRRSSHPDVELQLLLARRHFVQASCRNVIRGLDDLIPRLRRFE